MVSKHVAFLSFCTPILLAGGALAESFLTPEDVTLSASDVASLLFEDSFAVTTIDPVNWTVVKGATVDNLGVAEPSAAYSLRLNGSPSGRDVVESRVIDLSVYVGVVLTYYYQQTGAGDSPGDGDDLVVEYYDGSAWLELDRQPGSGPDMATFERRAINLPVEALHAGFRLRFRRDSTTERSSPGDWFVDDVRLVEVEPGLPADLIEVTSYAPLQGLAWGSAEAQDDQRRVVQQLGAPVEVCTRKTGIVFRLIPAGSFSMGSLTSESQRNSDETRHQVTLTKPFYCGKYEVTQAQWQQVMGSNPSYFKSAGWNGPVEYVTWYDAQTFLERLCQMEGVPEGTYRLLTEAEWEYACRAGTQTASCYGGNLDSTRANFNGSIPYGKGAVGPSRGTTVAVGSFLPNGWGLCDMHGNVNEWCQDWYGPYADGPQSDPVGVASGERRSIRGGHCTSPGNNCRSAERMYYLPANRAKDLGLRIARTAPSLDVVLFEDTFASTTIDSARWTAIKGATIDGVGISEPSVPYSLRLNGIPSGGDAIESRSIDLSACRAATLTYSYQRTGAGESPNDNDDLIVLYYDGAAWVELDRQLGSGPDMIAFERRTVGLPAPALQAAFKLSLQSRNATAARKNAEALNDWFVDDVKIVGDGLKDMNDGMMDPAPLPDDLVEVAPYAVLEGLASGSATAQEQQQAVQLLGLPLEIQTSQTRIAFRLIPAGAFMMGSPTDETGRITAETQHEVKLTQPFYCGKFEVTQAQWQQVMGTNPSLRKNAGQDAPVEMVSWGECQAFVEKLCQMEGVPEGTYRLLTEAEWEYACRAGTQTAFCYGNDLDANLANFNGNYPYGNAGIGPYRMTTVPVGSFRANAWGLYDMHGNVWEWCQDGYSVYPSRTVIDPLNPSSTLGPILRGGAYTSQGVNCRSAQRNNDPSGAKYSTVGLRIAREAPPYL